MGSANERGVGEDEQGIASWMIEAGGILARVRLTESDLKFFIFPIFHHQREE